MAIILPPTVVEYGPISGFGTLARPVFAVLLMSGLAACGGSGGGGVTADMLTFANQNPVLGSGGGGNGAPATTTKDANFADILNDVRRDDGAGNVRFNGRLNRAAQGHADDMLDNNYFSHTGLDGSSVEDRIRAQGYDPVAFGENIAGRQQSDEEVLRAWRDSPAHNRLLLARSVDEFGLGVAGRGADTRWVLVMAAD